MAPSKKVNRFFSKLLNDNHIFYSSTGKGKAYSSEYFKVLIDKHIVTSSKELGRSLKAKQKKNPYVSLLNDNEVKKYLGKYIAYWPKESGNDIFVIANTIDEFLKEMDKLGMGPLGDYEGPNPKMEQVKEKQLS